MKKMISILLAMVFVFTFAQATALAVDTDETLPPIEEVQPQPVEDTQPIEEAWPVEETQPIDATQPIEELPPMAEAQPAYQELGGDLYISFTVTHGNKDGTFASNVYSYGLKDEKLEKVATVPYTSQYPFTVFDRREGMIYFSYRKAGEKNDQIYSYNVDSGKTRRLTETLFAMNFIIPEPNRLLVIGVPTYATILALYPLYYDTQTGTLDAMDWDTDLTIHDIYSHPHTKELTLSAFSASEDWKRLGEQDPPSKPYIKPPSSFYIKKADSGSFEKLFELEDGVFVRAVARMGNQVVYAAKSHWDAETTDFYQYDIDSGNTVTYPHGAKLAEFFDFVYLTDDGRYVYFIRYGKNSGRELCRLDTSDGAIKTIYSAKYNYEELNNATVLSGTRVKPTVTKGFRAKASAVSNTITLTWKHNSSAAGHKVYRATSKNGTYKLIKKLKSGSTLRYNDKNLTKGKIYYYKLVPYTVAEGKTVNGPRTAVVKARVRGQ